METCIIINLSRYDRKMIDFFMAYYKNKFSNIFFTAPWCDDKSNLQDNLIGDYYSYYQWYGNAAAALKKLNLNRYDYVVLTTEEGILNPDISYANIREYLQLDSYDVSIPNAMPLFGFNGWHWYHVRHALYPFIYSANEWQKYLFTFDEALQKMRDFFGDYDVHINNSFFAVKTHESLSGEMTAYAEILGGYGHIPYPLAYSMTDMLVLKRKDIYRVIEQFEKWAAIGVFCEIAIPSLIISLFDKTKINCLAKNKMPIKAIPDLALDTVYGYNFEKILANAKDNPFIRFNIDKILKFRG